MAKKKWVKPKLIILTRGKPEERVLAFCKYSAGGPGSFIFYCDAAEPCTAACFFIGGS